MNIKLPKNPDDLRIKHFKAFKEWDAEQMSTLDEARFTAAFIGRSLNSVLTIDKGDFDKMYSHIIRVLSRMKIAKTPTKELTLNGVDYVLIDPDKTATSWHADWSEFVKNGGYDKDPVKVACLFYHPKGHFYGEIDRNENLVHPVRDKYDTFSEHLPLSTFIECSAFFLAASLRSTIKSTEKKLWEKRTINLLKRLRLLRGKSYFTN